MNIADQVFTLGVALIIFLAVALLWIDFKPKPKYGGWCRFECTHSKCEMTEHCPECNTNQRNDMTDTTKQATGGKLRVSWRDILYREFLDTGFVTEGQAHTLSGIMEGRIAALSPAIAPAGGDAVAGVRDTLIVAANNPVAHGGLEGLRTIMRAQAERLRALTAPSLQSFAEIEDRSHEIQFNDGLDAAPQDGEADQPVGDDRYSAGVKACIAWVEQRRHDFESEYGMVDPSTNAMEFGNSAREEYDSELVEIEEGLRALLAAQEAAK